MKANLNEGFLACDLMEGRMLGTWQCVHVVSEKSKMMLQPTQNNMPSRGHAAAA